MESYEPNTQPQTEAQPVQYEVLPAEPRCKWNWGAFLNPVVFGVGTKAYLCLLYFIPFISLIWCFVSGACAERWAWGSGFYSDEKSFRKAMQTWNRAGVFMAICTLVILVISIVVSVLLVNAGLMHFNFNFHVN